MYRVWYYPVSDIHWESWNVSPTDKVGLPKIKGWYSGKNTGYKITQNSSAIY